jgi:hypothetical protein
MSHTDDCPDGRSQHLTFAESSEKFLVDRKTFEELLLLVNWCTDELVNSRFRDCDNFLTALENYRLSDSPETSESFEIRKTSLLLNYYHDIIPEALDEVQNRMHKVGEILNSLKAVSNSFRGRYGND